MNKTIVRYEVTELHGVYCLFPDCDNLFGQLHHSIIGDKRNPLKLHRLLYSVENLIPSCPKCNFIRKGDNDNYQHYFWHLKCHLLGDERMIQWLEEVNSLRKVAYTPQIVPAGFIEWVKEI